MYRLLICTILLSSALCTLSPDDTKQKKKKLKTLSGPVEKSVQERALVREDISAEEILKHQATFHKDTDTSHFDGDVLGYVTPWNNHGYDVAKTFGKFSLISPVWLQLKPTSNGYQVTGTHDVDTGWIKDVRRANKRRNVKVVPRLLFEGFTMRDAEALFSSEHQRLKLADTVVNSVKDLSLDGVVVEVWSQFGGQRRRELAALVRQLAAALRHRHLTAGLVIPPAFYDPGNVPGMFEREDFAALHDAVDFFSLMTYDYSSPQRPGPNSPVAWVRRCVETLTSDPQLRSKILLGLNFYGNAYTSQGGSPIVAGQYLELLRAGRKARFTWDEASAEHLLQLRTDSGQHAVFYPSLQSVQQRVQLAEELGTGLAIWELGQGLDYFYDLL